MFVMSQKAILMFRRENSRLLLQDRSHRGYLSLNICQPATTAGPRKRVWHSLDQKSHYIASLTGLSIFFCFFGCIDTNRSSESDSSWIHLQTAVTVGFAQSGAITVSSACPQCCLFTLVAPDWLCVPGNKNCVHVRQCHMLLSPAACFIKSNRWTSAVGYTRNCLQTLRRLCMQVQPPGIGHLLVIYPRAAGGCSFTSELWSGIRKL